MVKILVSKTAPRVILWRRISLSFGSMVLGVDEKGVARFFEFMKGRSVTTILAAWQKKWPHTPFVANKTKGALPEKVCLTGTDFQIAVWKAIAKIPFGQTLSYAEIAHQIGSSRAVRAVGTACGANPVPILIPCHRVIASQGLGGFGGGLKLKIALLKEEGNIFLKSV